MAREEIGKVPYWLVLFGNSGTAKNQLKHALK